MPRLRIALFGSTGMIGQRILREALRRGHTVVVAGRDPARLANPDARVIVRVADILDPAAVAAVAKGQAALISAVGPTQGGPPSMLVEAARALVAGLGQAGRVRLLVAGGAGSLEVAPGVQLLETPDFPPSDRALAIAHRDALDVYRTAHGIDWTYLSPAAQIEPGERTGQFRTGQSQLLMDGKGASRISAEDFAVALLDEAEGPRHVRQRFTVAY